MAEFDAYGIMWYGNYVKWVRRAIGRDDAKVVHLRYHSPLSWGDGSVRFEIKGVDSLGVLVQIFSEETLCATAYLVTASEHMFRIESPCKRIVGKLSGGVNSFRDIVGSFVTRFRNWDSGVCERTMMDWFEQSRTQLIGGQKVLRYLSDDEDGAVVVAQVDNVVVPSISTSPRDGDERETTRAIACRTICTHVNWTVFGFRQELFDGRDTSLSTPLGSIECKLVFYDRSTKSPVPIPASVRDTILQNITIEFDTSR